MQNDLSTVLIAQPMKEQTAEELAKVFVENVLIYGQPQVVLSDGGANFLSDLSETYASYWA